MDCSIAYLALVCTYYLSVAAPSIFTAGKFVRR